MFSIPVSFNLFELIQPPSAIERPEYFVEEGNYFDEYAAAINNINNSTQASLSEPADLKGKPVDKCMSERVKLYKFPQFSSPSMKVRLPFIL